MEQSEQTTPSFYGYPRAVEAPLIPYKKKDDANPVFRGSLLVIGAWMCAVLNPNSWNIS